MTDSLGAAGLGIRAYSFWRHAGMGFPVDVKMLALEMSKVAPDPIAKILGKDLAGIDGVLARRQKGDWVILYDENVSHSGRVNFTLAHEFGHYMVHRTLQDEFECGQRELLDYGSAGARRIEAEANKFASYLLMPIADYREQLSSAAFSVDGIRHCAARYDVSFTAAVLKWLEFTEEAAFLAVARDDFVCWSYTSASARFAYLRPGTPVPRPALDRLGERQRFSAASVNVGPGVWHPTYEAEEALIVSDQFELAIFLVRFPSISRTEHTEPLVADTFDLLQSRVHGSR